MKRLTLLKLIIGFVFLYQSVVAQSDTNFPFSVDSTCITVWNGEKYVPLFIKGVNLGIATPGTFPGELKASEQDYLRWFGQIHEAGFNSIRLYTLHFPAFYSALRTYNLSHENYPLLVFQGIWLEEEHPDFSEDLYGLTEVFEQEITENVRAVHGDVRITERLGKAYGNFDQDISAWVIGYIIGREIHPPEIKATNENHAEQSSFSGNYLKIDSLRASEIWLTQRLDFLLTLEMQEYATQRPVSVSSWPTLDPLEHPFESNRYEDEEQLDFSEIDFSKAKAGFFVSYHAYPYYPDFISRDPNYVSFVDYVGQNSYLGYLTQLKAYYPKFPLIIAEFGTASSWGNAHYAQNGIHHGGLDELEQGRAVIRMFKNSETAGTGGGMVFSWMDEWFKRTWLTDSFDFNSDRRILWHNVVSAEQNFGLIGFKKETDSEPFKKVVNQISWISTISTHSDYAFLHVNLETTQHLGITDTLWVIFDTYDANLGEIQLPNGQLVTNGAEFLLRIMNNKAELFVTEAYDSYGLWDNSAPIEQKFQSIPSQGKPWKLLRWRNNVEDKETQFIGSLRVNRLETPLSSMDAVQLSDTSIHIKLPWNFLHFIDPSQMEVLHDDRTQTGIQTRISDGINIALSYKNQLDERTDRYQWQTWNSVENVTEFLKESYFVVENELEQISGNPVAMIDSVEIHSNLQLSAYSVLENDFSFDGKPLESVLVDPPQNGVIRFHSNGMFEYDPVFGFIGNDEFRYRAKAGNHLSEPVSVHLNVKTEWKSKGFVNVFPNPAHLSFQLESEMLIDSIAIYSLIGEQVMKQIIQSKSVSINVSRWAKGVYFISVKSGNDNLIKKLIVY